MISNLNILFRSYCNKKSFSTLHKPKSKQQAVKYCLLQPSPLEPQCQLDSKFLPAFAHTLPTAPRRHPRTTTSPKFTSPSSHKRLPPTPNFCYDRNYITIGSLHPWFFLLSRASARHQNSLAVVPPWHVVEPFCWTGSSTGSRSW